MGLCCSCLRPRNNGHKRSLSDNQITVKTVSSDVLIVDDQKLCIKMAGRLLDKANISHTSCYDGNEAVIFAKNCSYKLILMDKEMPQMNGIIATKAIRDMNVTTPIVALTTCDDDDTNKAFLNAGACKLIVKPLKQNDVIQLKRQYFL